MRPAVLGKLRGEAGRPGASAGFLPFQDLGLGLGRAGVMGPREWRWGIEVIKSKSAEQQCSGQSIRPQGSHFRL